MKNNTYFNEKINRMRQMLKLFISLAIAILLVILIAFFAVRNGMTTVQAQNTIDTYNDVVKIRLHKSGIELENPFNSIRFFYYLIVLAMSFCNLLAGMTASSIRIFFPQFYSKPVVAAKSYFKKTAKAVTFIKFDINATHTLA